MKKLISVVLTIALIIICTVCSTTTYGSTVVNNPEPTTTAYTSTATTQVAKIEPVKKEAIKVEPEIYDPGWANLESIGKVNVENGIFIATITIPADLVHGITQETLNANAGVDYISAKRNADGSITYKMTKLQHKAMLDNLSAGFDESFNKLVLDNECSFGYISHNNDFTRFDVYCSDYELNTFDLFYTVVFYTAGGLYGVFNGKTPDNIIVNIYNIDEELMLSLNSNDLCS